MTKYVRTWYVFDRLFYSKLRSYDTLLNAVNSMADYDRSIAIFKDTVLWLQRYRCDYMLITGRLTSKLWMDDNHSIINRPCNQVSRNTWLHDRWLGAVNTALRHINEKLKSMTHPVWLAVSDRPPAVLSDRSTASGLSFSANYRSKHYNCNTFLVKQNLERSSRTGE